MRFTTISLLTVAVTVAAGVSHAATTVGYWRFESAPDESGFGPDFLADSSGNGLTLSNPGGSAGQSSVPTAFSNPVPLTGASNDYHAFTLNANQRLELADNALLPTDDFTIEAMVQFGANVINNSLNADIASQWGGGTDNTWRLMKGTGNQLQIGLSGSGFAFYSAPSFTFASLTDYYIAAAVDIEPTDGATAVTFYIQDLTNGGPLQVIAGTTAATNTPGPLNNSTANFVIGGNDFTSELAATRIDEVRLSTGLVAQNDLLIVPEPGSLALMGLGGLLIARRRRG